MVDDCEYCPAVWHRMAVRSLEAAQSESASLRARLAEAEARAAHVEKSANEICQTRDSLASDLAQAREELAALRDVARHARLVAVAYGWDKSDPHPTSLAGGLLGALSKLSALPGAIEPAPNPPAAPSAVTKILAAFPRCDKHDCDKPARFAGPVFEMCSEHAEDGVHTQPLPWLAALEAAESAHRADSGGEGAK
jgi:hypothetical protein